jgi:serpin B
MLMPMRRPDRWFPKTLQAALAVALAGAGCGGAGSAADTGEEVRSTEARVTSPTVAPEDAATLAADNLAFAVDLYQAMRPTAGNLIFSPASISIALAMTYGGAATTTASEIATTMHFSLPPERLHPAFDALDLALDTPPAGADPGAFTLKLANAVWGQKGFGFLTSYLDLLAHNYGAGLRVADFMGAPDPSRAAINAWVSNQTMSLIPELLPAGSIDTSTRLVLTNAVYFHGDWTNPFDPNSPLGTFHAPAGDVSVPMMSNQKSVPVWMGSGFTAAALPYAGGVASMVLVIPDAGTFDAFESGLDAAALASILGAQTGSGAVSLPRFKFSTAASLGATLAAMGMPDAFNQATADFSGIDGAHDLYISDVVHQANIAVDEKGTTAAAATAVIIRDNAAIIPFVIVNRPFLFFIRHEPTGALLFAGRVLDPTM